ncbi:MAG: amino acid adenylation domain-containing protein, partial [Ferruginibacter sp.]
MEIKEFIASLEKSHFSLSLKDGKLLLNGNKKKLTKAEIDAIKKNAEVINYIKENKDELIKYLSNGASIQSAEDSSKKITSIYRLSGLQEGMLFHGLYDEKGGGYIEQFSCDVSGVVLATFMESWKYLFKKHTVLRSSFIYDKFSIPVQCVYQEVALPVEVIDYRDLPGDRQQKAIELYGQTDATKPFDFQSPPLMRVGLIRVTDDNYRMLWTSHHILFDGWSRQVLMEEFLTIYELLLSGKSLPVIEEDRYEDYIRFTERIDKDQQEAYWSNYLKGVESGTLLPFIGSTIERTKGVGEYKLERLELDLDTSLSIQNFAQKNRLTVNTLMQGVWALLLHRYTASNDIVYGIIVSGRPDDLPGVERRVGLYINTSPLHSKAAEDQHITGWLQALQAAQVEARQYQHSPLSEVQKWSDVPGDLFDSLLVFENYPVSKVIGERQWSLRVENVEMHEQTNYPLTILVSNNEQIKVQFNYNSALLKEVYVKEIKDHFKHVLLQIVDAEKTTINEIQLLKPAEINQLLTGFNDTKAEHPSATTIANLFEEQAIKSPDQLAVVFEKEQLDYKELNERSNQLAHYLRSKGIREETLVPICVERSIEMIVGVLGILKAGAVYVPIDPEYPAARISYMLQDMGAALVISSSKSKEKLGAHDKVQIVEIDSDWNSIASQPTENIKTTTTPNRLTYILYTSGSTGIPKGVKMPESNLVNLLRWQEKQFENHERHVLQFASLNFDVSFQEIFSTLCFGSSLHLISEDRRKDMAEIVKDIDEQGLTHLFVPYIVLKSLADYVASLDRNALHLQEIIVAGEQLKLTEDIGIFLEKNGIKLINQYGPTEAHVVSSYTVTDNYLTTPLPPIGKPIDNVQLYILNPKKDLCAVGIPGELYIAGAQVAQGYLNRPELTAEKFIPNIFDTESGSMMYKTGDLARWLPDGNIEYLGRIDEQVKIRGYRIELGEIESVLQQSELVKQAVVLAREDNSGSKRLVAYVVPEKAFDKEAMITHLRSRLPEYMVPALWVELESLPLTPNGKINKKALPDPDASDLQSHEYVTPRNETEQQLANVWQELLGVERVGIHDNFFELGGHSLLAMRVVSAIRRSLKSELAIKDLFENPTIAGLSSLLQSTTSNESLSVIEVQQRPEHIPLSFSQERLWFIDQLEGSLQYHIPAVLRLKGKLEPSALVYALQNIVQRHEVLRTVIKEVDGEGHQYITGDIDPQLINIDGAKYKNDPEGLQDFIKQFIRKPFDLSKDHMLRVGLINLDEEEENILVVAMHHIASDGWSISIIVKELVELYSAYTQGRHHNLSPLPIQYADYAIWQRNYLKGEILDKKIAYWKEKLDAVTPLQLPLDYERPVVQSVKGAAAGFTIDKSLTGSLQQLSQQQGVTLFMTLLAAFKTLLHRHSGQQDIVVGTPIANRTQHEIEELIGFFVNTLALRSNVNGSEPFTELLQQVKATTLEAYEHQDVPFEKVVDAVVQERDMSRSPLFQVMFVLHNTPEIPELRLGDVALSPESFDHNAAKFDLTFSITATELGLRGSLQYCTDLFNENTISRLLLHFNNLLQAIVSDPQQKIALLPMLGNEEKQQLLEVFNNTSVEFKESDNIITLFEKQAAKSPQSIALIFGEERLTYQQLDERSNQLAHCLRSRGVKKEVLVPICINKSPEMIVGILGILKAGGAYVPVDPAYPTERILFMLLDSNAEIILTAEKHVESLSSIFPEEQIIILDGPQNDFQSLPATAIKNPIQSQQLAYVLYTSGSTGQPKGVAVQHASLVNHLIWFNKQYNITDKDSSILISSFSFDGSMTATWPVLLGGGTLHLLINNDFDPSAILSYVSRYSVTYIKTLPGIFNALINAENFNDRNICASIRLLIVGGERMNVEDFNTYLDYYPDVLFANHYGPTECTISSSFYLIDKTTINAVERRSLIGRPVANTSIFIVGDEDQLNSVGVIGEICIAGAGVARGYINRPDLTAEKFVNNHFGKSGERMYKTGDLGRWLADGNIEYIGRKDDQVKIRGYRIELGEIENVLQKSEQLSNAVVLAKSGTTGDRLVAYVIPEQAFNSEEIVSYLKDKLPAYMIPDQWVEMEFFPLSPNGKINREALPDTGFNALITQQYVAPRNETERVIAKIWEGLLGVEQVGINDNFFQRGGHSLMAMRVISSIRKQLKIELAVKSLFLFPTIAGLAEDLKAQDLEPLIPPVEKYERPELIPLSFNQERLWFIDHLEGTVQYHLPSVLQLKGNLDVGALAHALQQIINRHEILRTVLIDIDGHGYQKVLKPHAIELPVIDGSKYINDKDELQRYIQQLVKAPFDLSKDLMMRVSLIKLAEEDHVVVVTTHHIASDGWSTSVLVNEVIELYKSFIENRPAQLPELKVQYADYAIWQHNYLQGEVLDNKINYWKEKLQDVEPLRVPTDFPRPAVQSTRGAFAHFDVDKELANELHLLSQQEGATFFMTLLAAFKVLLYRYSGQQDICVGTGIAGREQTELENLIGFFVNTLALRTNVSGYASFLETLQQVRTTTLEAFEHQNVPFAKVVDAVTGERDLSRTPLFQVIFVLQNTPDTPELKLGEVEMSMGEFVHNTAKFDLTFMVNEIPSGLSGTVEYNTDLYTPATIERMMKHYKELLRSIVKEPKQNLDSLAMLNQSETQQLLVEFNNTNAPLQTEKTVIELFEEQAIKKDNATVIVYKEQVLTFKELNERSNQLAHYLKGKGVKKEMHVPICMEQSSEMIVGILAILKTGAAYVPIDPEYPGARIKFILEDINASVVVSNSVNSSRLISEGNLAIVEVDGDQSLINIQPVDNLSTSIEPDQLAYIIYTSGSTGQPKGVMISHASLLSYLLNNKTRYITEGDNAGSFIHLSYTFDASLTGIFMPLIAGKSIVIGSKKSVEVFEDSNLWKYAPYDFIKLTPSHLELLQANVVNANGELLTKTLVVGGEALRYNHLDFFINNNLNIEIVNEYGPTEATVGCSTYRFNTSDNDEKIKNGILIGKPIDNVQLYILNDQQDLLPVGVPGEICISGAGLADGYLNLPELTAAKFVPNLFSTEPGARMYRTGDIGRWLIDGNIEYLGRKDDQVKIRGYRIELGEIEAQLSSAGGIKNAVVTVTENEQLMSKKLNAYLQVDKEQLPLLSNYLELVNKKQTSKSELNILPNGLPIINSNLNEVKFLYEEIFTDHCYLKHGISLNPDSTVIDIGANAGFFTVFLNILSQDIKVYSVEPIPEVYNFLSANRQLYNVKGKALQLAILDEEQDIDFTYYPGVSIVSGISEDITEVREVVKSYIKNSQADEFLTEEIDSMLEVKLESKRINVHAKTVSQIIAEENIEKIDLLKIDVENSEHHVINGIAEEDWDKIGSIIIEVHDSNGRLKLIKDILDYRGFNTYVEKEQMLSEDDILYNLFAIKDEQKKGLTTLGENDILRSAEWMHPEVLEKNVREDIAAKLPDYMMPAHIVLLDQFPLTRNGKIDKNALPDAEASELHAAQYEAAETETEKALTEIWKNLLELNTIGLNDNFFNVGGDSLLAVRLISKIRKELGIEVRISDLFEHPTIGSLAAHLAIPADDIAVPSISLQERPAHIPLSFSQERLWFIDRLDGSVQYHIPTILRLTGKLNIAALNKALQTIINRHEILRTVILENEGEGYQYILGQDQWEMHIIDGAQYGENRQQLELDIKQLINAPFNLAEDQMIRADLIRLNEEDHILVVTMHHIVSDGWSLSIIVKEVVELYAAYIEGRSAQLPVLPLQYADFAIWQRSHLQGDTLKNKVDYWKNKLDGVEPFQLPFDSELPVLRDAKGAVAAFKIDKRLADKLQSISQQHGATLFMTLLSAFEVLLYRYSGQQDICVGTSVAGRQMQEVEGLIGFFINALALRTDVDGNISFNELLKKVRATTLEAYEHQDVPFEKVVDAVVKERDMGRSPLFQVMFVLQNTLEVPELTFGGVHLSREAFPQDTTKFDLSVVITETEVGLQGSFQYSTDVYGEQSIVRMIDHFKNIIQSIITAPQQKISELQMLTSGEEQQLLTLFNSPVIEPVNTKTVPEFFDEQVIKNPQGIALVFADQQLTYKELDERSNQFAHYLKDKGVIKETLVPVCMDRSPEMIIAMLGILKAGGAYVPIDPGYPIERIKYMVEDSMAALIISTKNIELPLPGNIEVINIDKDWQAISKKSIAKLKSNIQPDQLAYVIYTSGSTGQPKGVMIEHRNVANLIEWHIDEYKVSGSSRATSMAGVGFDAFGWEVWPYLSAGASLYIIDDEKRLAVAELLSFFSNNNITHSFISTAVVQEFVNASRHKKLALAYLLTGGDKLSVSNLEGISYAFVNNYGPTENTVVATNYHLSAKDEHKVPSIGKPILNTTIHILNGSGQLVPVDVSGEICIGGTGLARGYWNRETLTTEKFILDPFTEAGNSRLYKTGDLGRWLLDGNIEYLGRIDEQVKIRGYRIELGEIESVLQQSEQVKQAVVLAREDNSGSKRLVAYVVPETVFDKEAMITHLRSRLP